jgi:hypothetical protein
MSESQVRTPSKPWLKVSRKLAHEHRRLCQEQDAASLKTWTADAGEEYEYVANSLLSLILPKNVETSLPLSRDLQLLSKTASSLIEAVEEGILTEDEATSVIVFLVSRFTARRVDRVLEHLASREHASWFMAASKKASSD